MNKWWKYAIALGFIRFCYYVLHYRELELYILDIVLGSLMLWWAYKDIKVWLRSRREKKESVSEIQRSKDA